jgi:hypothetical protein
MMQFLTASLHFNPEVAVHFSISWAQAYLPGRTKKGAKKLYAGYLICVMIL